MLHLVDRSTGGVPVAVRGYIANTPPGFSHVVASPHVGGTPAPVWREGDGKAEIHHVAWEVSTPLRAVRSLRGILRQVDPDVVHAHSSFPGAYARLLGAGDARLVYTPHCFAFERRDIGAAPRAVYRAIERALRGRADVLASGGPGEAVAARGLGYPEDRLRVIPNVPSVHRPASTRRPAVRPTRTLTVGMLGRWAPQKDPAAFISLVRRLRSELPGVTVRAKWIGGGDGAEGAPDDIDVTGWQTPDGVATELASLDVYLHTAAWEAAVAIAILDAWECGIPILARPIPAMPGLPPMVGVDDGLSGLVEAVRSGRLQDWADDNRARWGGYLDGRFTPQAQRIALGRVWG